MCFLIKECNGKYITENADVLITHLLDVLRRKLVVNLTSF